MCPRKHQRRAMAGLTLLEVLIALAILSIALIALSRTQSQSLSVTGESRQMTTLALLAQAKMAEIEAVKPLEDMSKSGDFGEDYPGYEWQVKVADAGQSVMKKIELLVRDKRSPKDNSLTLTLYKYAAEETQEASSKP